MKKIGVLTLIMLFSLSAAFAQKIAVLDFKAGVGISQTDVDGLSSTFVTYFNPRGYQLVERSQINQVIEEQGFQQTSLTESQMVRLGQIMNLSKIVVGDVNIVGGSPNLDVRVIDVQSGEVTGRDGATFAWTNYRATMQQLAQKVAGQIGVVYGGSGQSGFSQPSGKSPSGKVETILGYLQVYPEDLGSFNGEPTSVIAAVNRQKLYDYGDWRLPTNEELSLMATSKDKLGMGSINGYMSRENASSGGMKIVRLVRTGDIGGNGEGSLKLKLPLGRSFTIFSNSSMNQTLKIQGQTINQSTNIDVKQDFNAIGIVDKTVTLETWIESVKMSISQQGGMTFHYDSDYPEKTSPMLVEQVEGIQKVLHVPYRVVYDEYGALDNSSDNVEMNMLENVIIEIPKEELKKGSSWSIRNSKDINGTLVYVDWSYVVVSLSDDNIDVNVSGKVIGSSDISGNYHGTIKINPQIGIVVNSNIKGNVSMTIIEQGLQIPVNMISTMSTIVEINDL